ncbi:MAG: AMP-binding protein [Actinobacteria bacterium]|nr:AMP-binding protein [Actinomycetota bacterium]MCA1719970.1 AMP-binding protein [Actinomycetota bacterium]
MKELIWHRQLLPALSRHASRPLLTDTATGTTTTYAEHGGRVLRLASALRDQLGLQRSDRFAVLSLNSARFEELYHAGLLGAGVVNPLNLRFAPRELTHVLADSETKVVFVDATFAPVIEQVRAEAGIGKVVLLGDGDVPHDFSYEDLLASGEEVVPAEPDEDDAAILMYTGGTTGLPKGVLLTQRSMMLTKYHIQMTFAAPEDEVYLAQVPMFHAASMGAILGVNGGRLVTVPFFDPPAVLAAMEEHQATNSIMVPTMIAMTFAHPSYSPEKMASLQRLTYGASPMPRPVLDRLRRELPQVGLFQGYGMTESAALVSCLLPEDHEREDKLASAGRPVAGTVVSIQDALGKELPTGEVGEVCVRGGQFMTEYWRRPDETAAAFANGWYHSGDAGYLDADGYLFLVDRTKDMIVTGGENVYSTEVEQALASHPAIAQAAVIGVPDDVWGEAVHAVVVLKPDASATEAELIEHCRPLIAGYKVPKAVELRSEPLPLSGAMKVLKRELRAPYWADRSRSVN